MNVLSCNIEGILCWKNQIIQGTRGMKTPNRYSHTVRSSHISKKIQKNPTEKVKRWWIKKLGRGFNMKVESRGFIYFIKKSKAWAEVPEDCKTSFKIDTSWLPASILHGEHIYFHIFLWKPAWLQKIKLSSVSTHLNNRCGPKSLMHIYLLPVIHIHSWRRHIGVLLHYIMWIVIGSWIIHNELQLLCKLHFITYIASCSSNEFFKDYSEKYTDLKKHTNFQ